LGHGLVAAINELNEFGLVAVFCDEGMLFFFGTVGKPQEKAAEREKPAAYTRIGDLECTDLEQLLDGSAFLGQLDQAPLDKVLKLWRPALRRPAASVGRDHLHRAHPTPIKNQQSTASNTREPFVGVLQLGRRVLGDLEEGSHGMDLR
jgi:hypothetical protein